MPRFRKKPVEIEAYQWTGPWCSGDPHLPTWLKDAMKKNGGAGTVYGECAGLVIITLEGALHASANDWIIKGTKGELYPCKPDIFSDIYERVGQEERA